jgi:hypothetical protein
MTTGKEGASRKSAPRRDEFVSKVAADPREHRGACVMVGYVGESTEPDHARLYLDEGLNTYVDVPASDILASQELAEEHSPLGGSRVWVKPDAKIKYGSSAMSQFGGMMEGPLSAYLAAASGWGGAAAIRPSMLVLCQSVHRPCGTWICTAGQPYCPVQTNFVCPSVARCGSWVDACPSALGCTFACQFEHMTELIQPGLQQMPGLEQQMQMQYAMGRQDIGPAQAAGAQQFAAATAFIQCHRSLLVPCVTQLLIQCRTFIHQICNWHTRIQPQCQITIPTVCWGGCQSLPVPCQSGFVCQSVACHQTLACNPQTMACNPGGGFQTPGF